MLRAHSKAGQVEPRKAKERQGRGGRECQGKLPTHIDKHVSAPLYCFFSVGSNGEVNEPHRQDFEGFLRSLSQGLCRSYLSTYKLRWIEEKFKRPFMDLSGAVASGLSIPRKTGPHMFSPSQPPQKFTPP